MTPSEQWILGLFAVYSIPAFLLGIGAALLFGRLRRTAAAPDFLSPERTFERRDLIALGPAATRTDRQNDKRPMASA